MSAYITLANWNLGGARLLQLKSEDADKRAPGVKPPRKGKAREDVRHDLNSALQELLHDKPEIVTLQEVVRYAADGNPKNAKSVLDLEECYLTCNDVKYKYYPCWLVDNHVHLDQGKWKKVTRMGGWRTEDSGPFFAQGNAILIREDLELYPIWGVPDVNVPPPEERETVGEHARENAENAKGHRFIEQVPLQPGLYFGDRDTEPRAASVAHLVLSKLTAGGRYVRGLDIPLDIFIVNVHLTTLTMERDGVPDVDMEGERTRLRQLEIILKQIVSPYNRWRRQSFPIRGDHYAPGEGKTHTRYNPIWVVAGDFNFTPDSNEYDAMVRGGFIDLINPAEKAGITLRQHTKAKGTGRAPTHTLDYIFGGPRFHAIDPLVADRNCGGNQVLTDDCYRVSDHRPLIFKVPIELDEPEPCKYCTDCDRKKEN